MDSVRIAVRFSQIISPVDSILQFHYCSPVNQLNYRDDNVLIENTIIEGNKGDFAQGTLYLTECLGYTDSVTSTEWFHRHESSGCHRRNVIVLCERATVTNF